MDSSYTDTATIRHGHQEHDKSLSRTRIGVTTGQLAISTPSYKFTNKLNVLGGGNTATSAQSLTLNLLS